jgi:hypothetical protein
MSERNARVLAWAQNHGQGRTQRLRTLRWQAIKEDGLGERFADLQGKKINEFVWLEEAVVSITSFAMFAVRDTSYLDPKCEVR